MASTETNPARDGGRSGQQLTSWEVFCREEARQWASTFLERVRRFKVIDVSLRDIHDSTFTNEFSAAFLEEASVLLTSANSSTNDQSSQPLTRGLPPHHDRSTRAASPVNSSARKSSKAKSWLSNLFRWPKASRTYTGVVSSTSVPNRASRSNINILKEGTVQILNMNADNSSSSDLWQQCSLVLLEDHGNHQLKVYAPPKSNFPKMSLLCFLIKEIRPATRLEIPDSTTCFVIKSENLSEYVFDACSEDLKQQWMSVIARYCTNLSSSTNGHLPMYVMQRSNSVSVANSSSVRPYTQPKPLPPVPGLADGMDNLRSNSAVNGRRGSNPSGQSSEFQVERISYESDLMDVSPFIQHTPSRSPTNRHRKAQSMYVESVLNTHSESARDSDTAHAPPAHVLQVPQGPRFPYDSPSSSPPPLPKRGDNFKIPSVDNSSSADKDTLRLAIRSPHCLTNNANYRVEPSAADLNRSRRMSQPQIGLPTASIGTHNNLDNCSRSSSSAALHPVSLADINRRSGSIPPSPGLSAQVSEKYAIPPSTSAYSRMRKSSAPVCILGNSIGKLLMDRDMINPESAVLNRLQDISHSPNLNSSNEHLSSSPTIASGRLSNSNERVFFPQSDDVATVLPAITSYQTSEEDMTSKATLSFPYMLNSPLMGRHDRDNANETNSEPQLQERRAPYTRLNVSSLTCRLSDNPSHDRDERSNSRASNNTVGSNEASSQDPMDNTILSTGNPLYIETTESESYVPGTTHTKHPYENWATTSQDVQNLRALSQFPWFHGMISRNNASQLVLAAGDAGTGQYLLRQSESRVGDFVLTFNYHNKAKHLRLTVDEGGCNIQHLWFDDVPSMLEYFKINSIPLESFWLNNDVKLTTYINRKRSDTFRTTTVVNVERLNLVPPRRSHSLHVMSQVINANSTPETTSTDDRAVSSAGSSTSHSTNSLPRSSRNNVSTRQFLNNPLSSSAGNMTVHGVSQVGANPRVQRSHSTHAGSRLDPGIRNGGHNSIGNNRGMIGRSSQTTNPYVYRNY